MQTYFMHYRKLDTFGNTTGKGGVTVAIQPTGTALVVGLAFCNPADNFNRKLGRTIASGRIEASCRGRDQGNNVMVILMEKFDDPIKDVVHEHVKDLISEFEYY